jgi:hypothetical protein
MRVDVGGIPALHLRVRLAQRGTDDQVRVGIAMRLEMLIAELGGNFWIMDSRRWRLKPVDQLDDTRMVHLPKCFDLRLVLARLLE